MEEIKTNVELEEENVEAVNEGDTSNMNNDDLKAAIDEQMSKLRRQSILIGAQTACSVIVQKIYAFQRKPGKKSYRDYERLVKDIQSFCETGISRKVNADGTTSPVEADDNKVTVEFTE